MILCVYETEIGNSQFFNLPLILFCFVLFCFIETEPHIAQALPPSPHYYIIKNNLELLIVLPLPPKDGTHVHHYAR